MRQAIFSRARLVAFMIALTGTPIAATTAWAQSPDTVHFRSRDGATQLVGFLFKPAGGARAAPAVVLLHGRGGPYSSLARGTYDATTLSKRHMFWGQFWARKGYAALLVDSFGPRGFPEGFAAGTHGERPDAVNEVTVRPLDAYGALSYLRSRQDIDGGRIALMGWSNGGSATLAAMADAAGAKQGFRGAVAFYPACGLHGRFRSGYQPYAPVRVFSGDDDEEVSTDRCDTFVEKSRAAGGDIDITIYPGATHDFDDPGRKRQEVDANAAARAKSIGAASAFVARLFGRRG